MRAKTSQLFTFGYEGLSIQSFIERLQQVNVQLIVDVRGLPLSRKRGFSKTAFREALEAVGILYEHRPALGCPKAIRDRYKADGDWGAYTRSFLTYLSGQKTQINELSLSAQVQQTCLVCFEADFGLCHRTYVARAAHAAGAPTVCHLTARAVIADEPARLAA